MVINSSNSDGKFFSDSDLKTGIVDCTVDIPAPEPLSLYEDRIFNYRLWYAPRIVENVLRAMTNRFGGLLTAMTQNINTVTAIVLFYRTLLHNMIRLRYLGIHHSLVIKQWRQGVNLQDME